MAEKEIMTLFTTLLDQRLGPSRSASVTRFDDGRVILRISSGGVELDGFVELEPDCLVIDEMDEEAAAPLFELGGHWRRIHDYLARFPATARRGDDVVTFSLALPASMPLWSSEGLWATVVQTRRSGEQTVEIMEQEVLVLGRAALDAGDWQARLDAFDERRAAWSDRQDDLCPEDACLELSEPPVAVQDDGWDAFIEEIGLDVEGLGDRVAPVVAAVFDRLAAVRARYEGVYGLKLPAGLAHLPALIAALGEMPAAPPGYAPWLSEPPPPGEERGRAWLDASLAMRVAGLSEWFTPTALERRTHDATVLYEEVPRGGEGPLDPRLDMRFRCDAPQLVTFLAGDSDGLHWGFWYDSPDHAPVIAHNYARDSAETSLDGEPEMLPFLRSKIERSIEEAVSELQTAADEESRGYPRMRWRALRVVKAHLEVIASQAAERAWDDVPACPWPRTMGYPIGSPTLALRPDAGVVPEHVPGFGTWTTDLPEEQLERWIGEARRELTAGRPAYAHALGLYLHWADRDVQRAAAGQLLLDAYEALGFHAFAGILKVHLLHRDLRSVGVFERD
jgi:hypothetical protein